LKNLSDYSNVSNIKKHLKLIKYTIVSIFITITYLFYFIFELKIITSILFFLPIGFTIYLLYKKHYLSTFLEFWSAPETVIIDNITYQFISLYKTYPHSYNLELTKEDRSFHNGLLSRHNSCAIIDGYYGSDSLDNSRFWYLGEPFESLKEVEIAHKMHTKINKF